MSEFSKISLMISKDLENLESQRLSQKKKVIIVWIFFIISLAVVTLYFIQLEKIWVFYGWAIIILLSISIFFQNIFIKKYRNFFKSKVIEPILKTLNPDLKYLMNESIGKSLCEKSDYFPFFNIYKGEDLIAGKVNGKYYFAFSEITVRSGQILKANGKKLDKKKVETIFKGLFILIESPLYIKHPIIFKNKTSNYYRYKKDYGVTRIIPPEKSIGFENYDIYCDVDDLADKIIYSPTTDIIIKINAFLNGNISFSFVEDKIFIFVETNKNYFKPRLFETAYKSKAIEGFYNEAKSLLEAVTQIIETNQSIAGKLS